MQLRESTMQHLMRIYPRAKRKDIEQLYTTAAQVILSIVDPAHAHPLSTPPELYGAALLRVHAQLAKPVRDRNSAWNA